MISVLQQVATCQVMAGKKFQGQEKVGEFYFE